MWVFVTKSARFGYCWARIFWKIYCHIWNQHLWICLIAKYREIMKMPKFGTKNALYWYFLARVFKNYSYIWNQHPQTCLFAKFHGKTIIPKFGTKYVWFMCCWPGIWKEYCHIWNQHSRISLTAKCCEKKCLILASKMHYFGSFVLQF